VPPSRGASGRQRCSARRACVELRQLRHGGAREWASPFRFTGQIMARRLIDLSGRQFGRWTVVAIHPERHRGHVRWFCRCQCDTERVVVGDSLHQGISQSCGCLAREKTIKRNTTHGLSKTRAYSVWTGMLQRCLNPRHRAYAFYGGRGITVCERWLIFENFFADMGEPPEGRTLDRHNNDLGYRKANCHWATRAEQIANRRPSKRKRRRATLAEINAYSDSLARAGSMEVAP
jgi:hypothetical protein